jgi:hypothetical protein
LRRRLAAAERDLGMAHERRDALADLVGSTTDHARLSTLSTELAAAQAELDRAEEHWLECASATEAAGLQVD